jgi:hypothetical protein
VFAIAALVLLALALSACGGANGSSVDADRRLIAAAREGDLERVRSLLESEADVHARDASGATALTAAAERLLETDIEIDHVNRLG